MLISILWGEIANYGVKYKTYFTPAKIEQMKTVFSANDYAANEAKKRRKTNNMKKNKKILLMNKENNTFVENQKTMTLTEKSS